MQRAELIDLLTTLKLAGIRANLDDVHSRARSRRHGIEHVLGELLTAQLAEKRARSVRYQMGVARLPLTKHLADFRFDDSLVNETLVREFATGAFLTQQRNVVLDGGTGTGKSHFAIAIARACLRDGAKGRFFNIVDLVNRLESEARSARPGHLADELARVDL